MELLVNRVFMLTVLLFLCFRAQGQITQVHVVVAKDGSGNFTKISDAILSAPNHSAERYYIKITEGLYEENIFIGKQKTNLALIGDGMNKTIILGNKSYGPGVTTYETATVAIQGNRFLAMGITFENAAGPYKNQAVALKTESDFTAFYKCRITGYQDTLYTKAGNQFFRECEIFGAVDFICGNAKVIFQNCNIYARKPQPGKPVIITAQKRDLHKDDTGMVVQNCTITAAPGLLLEGSKFKTFLGRPWGTYSRTVITQSHLDSLIDPSGWLPWVGHKDDKPYYAEYENRGPGADTKNRVKWAKAINSSKEAALFTVRNFIQGEAWIPSTGIPYFLDFI